MAAHATSGLVLLGSQISRDQFNTIKRASGKQKEAALAAIDPAKKQTTASSREDSEKK